MLHYLRNSYHFTTLHKRNPIISRTRICAGIGIISSYLLYRQGKVRFEQMHFTAMYNSVPDTEALTQEYFGDSKQVQRGFLGRFWDFLRRQIRLLHLIIKFTPLAFALPISWLFKKHLFKYWLKYLLYTLQSAGPLWIKLGQWASHRGDIFGEEITKALEQLRDAATPHSWKETQIQFEQAFGQQISDVLQEFNPQPIASGSIAQVHKAKLGDIEVAVKVRHPDIVYSLETDIKILYRIANFLSNTLGIKKLGMPVTYAEFQKTLVSQTDLRIEGRNLKMFGEKFQNNPHVEFPKVVDPYVSSNILVETFEDAIPLTQFLQMKKTKEHYTLANLGLKAFYKMLIYDNFIHADCHAGNIMIKIRDPENAYQQLSFRDKLRNTLFKMQDHVYEIVDDITEAILIKIAEWQLRRMGKNTNIVMELNREKKSDEKLFTKFLKDQGQSRKEVKIVFIDPGMVTILNKSDRIAFIKLVMFVTLRRPIECGKLMLELAQYNNKIIEDKVKERFMIQMQDLFTNVCEVPLAQMNIGQVLRSMLEILRDNGMSIEGYFAALLTNMIVLEGLAKELDPSLNIVAKAASFLMNIRTIDKTIDVIIQQAL